MMSFYEVTGLVDKEGAGRVVYLDFNKAVSYGLDEQSVRWV